MTMAAMAPPGTVRLLVPPVEPARTGFGSADGVSATIAGKVVVPTRGLWKPGPGFFGVVVLGVNVLVVVTGGNDDDVVSDVLVTDGGVGVETRLEDDRERVGTPTTGEACTTVGMVGGPCVLEGGEVLTGGMRSLGPNPSSSYSSSSSK